MNTRSLIFPLLGATILAAGLAPSHAGAARRSSIAQAPSAPDVQFPPAPVRARVAQVEDRLRWTVSLRGAPDFAQGDSVCLQLRYGALPNPRAQVCVAGASLSYSQLTQSGRAVSTAALPGTVTASTPTQLTASFPLADAKLARRSFSWQVVSTRTCRTACAIRLPSDHAVAARTVAPQAPRPTGCRPSGAPQVTGAPGASKTVALTFDDGPSTWTASFLSVLEREQVPATFFLIGSQVAGRGPLLRRMLADGDAIGNHTWDHADISRGAPADEIARTQAAIRAATGYTPCMVRPPYGATSTALVTQLRADGLESVLWNVDPTDWALPGTSAIVSRVLAQTKPGSIIIMHDGGGDRSQTLAALPTIIRSLAARGYRFATVPQLLGYETERPAFRPPPATSAG